MWKTIISMLAKYMETKEAKKIFEKEINKFGIKISNIISQSKKGNLKAKTLSRVLKKLPSQTTKNFLSGFKKFMNQNGNEDNIINFILNMGDNKIDLSSSWLDYGIFKINRNNPQEGKLWLGIDGKEYDMKTVKTSIWIAMYKAKGKNGAGAGSVLWDTIWQHKRTKSIMSGGVRGSREARISAQRLINLQIARNTKKLNRVNSVKSSINKKVTIKLNKPKNAKNIFKKTINKYSKIKL